MYVKIYKIISKIPDISMLYINKVLLIIYVLELTVGQLTILLLYQIKRKNLS